MIDEVAGITSVANSLSIVPRLRQTVTMARTVTGAPTGIQEPSLAVPGSARSYEIESIPRKEESEAYRRISETEKLEKGRKKPDDDYMPRLPVGEGEAAIHNPEYGRLSPLYQSAHVDVLA
ncbi:MAG: hypothetical protein O2857_30430 [Planctomycetota bacterium]|nr:hypothetical protein [Planctomycetota bacterium]